VSLIQNRLEAIDFIVEVANKRLLIYLLLGRPHGKLFCLRYSLIQIFDLRFVHLDNFLAKIRPFCELTLHLLVVKQLLLKLLDTSHHLM